MNAGKQRRKRYRAALRAAQATRPDRLSEMIAAIKSGGTAPCESCTLVRPVGTMDERGVCRACQLALSRVAKQVPAPSLSTSVLEPDTVWVDASFHDGEAGLAVTGALGEHTRFVDAVSSTQAETLALRWAMEIARSDDRRDLTFRTDCQAAWRALGQTSARSRWRVEMIPRSRNQRADYLAGRARIGGAA